MNRLATRSTNTLARLQKHLMGPVQALTNHDYKRPVERVVCVNGMSVSVQASAHSYCQPRDNFGPWYQVELGFPSVAPPEDIMAHAEEADKPTDTVYGYVPIESVAAWIDACGGFAPLPSDVAAKVQWELDDNSMR